MNTPLSVSEFNEQIKAILETTFSFAYIEGEVSNLTYHSSGHIYFSLKDKKSMISCVMFKGNAQYLKFRLETGAQIVIRGSITIYGPRGSYQFVCKSIEPLGIGALSVAYEQLKVKLENKGYFKKAHKKTLPLYPKSIYVVTSNTGAAIKDMKKILSVRYPLAKMILIPTVVQGVLAKEAIVRNIQKVDAIASAHLKDSLLIVGRGGGTIEDLWAFNEESVCEAIYNAKIPIISAVGHESDFLLCDLVADRRASTPSNAIEIATPNINDLRQFTDELVTDFTQKYRMICTQKEQTLYHLLQSFEQQSFEKRFLFIASKIKNLEHQFTHAMQQILSTKYKKIMFLEQSFDANDPQKRDKKGYVQLSRENKVISIKDVAKKDILSLQDSRHLVTCKVIDMQEICE